MISVRFSLMAAIAVVVLIPQIIVFALLRLRSRFWPRIASVAAAFFVTIAMVLIGARVDLGKPLSEASSPEYGMGILAIGVWAGLANVAIALIQPRTGNRAE
ncbi:MAG TPA: hypothetical protein VFV49_09810 [Thermoanaerobaculia bacterium]|nr:hypothetical protein [Thermoanaerobaculia bacterium]